MQKIQLVWSSRRAIWRAIDWSTSALIPRTNSWKTQKLNKIKGLCFASETILVRDRLVLPEKNFDTICLSLGVSAHVLVTHCLLRISDICANSLWRFVIVCGNATPQSSSMCYTSCLNTASNASLPAVVLCETYFLYNPRRSFENTFIAARRTWRSNVSRHVHQCILLSWALTEAFSASPTTRSRSLKSFFASSMRSKQFKSVSIFVTS